MHLKILDPMSIRVILRHFLGFLRLQILGTGAILPLCHSVKSTSLCKYALRKKCKLSRFLPEIALKESGGTIFKPGDLLFASFKLLLGVLPIRFHRLFFQYCCITICHQVHSR